MANVYKGKSAAEWGALGKFGKARAASRGGQTGKEWKGEGEDPYNRSKIMSDIQKDTKLKSVSEQTNQFKDWTQGASGFTDIYRKGKAGEIKGPEYDIPDVDIYGYPTGWKQEAGTKDGAEGQWITTDKDQRYFKPTQGGGGGDTSTGSGDSTVTTSLRPDQTPSLRDITSDMDLRDMITNVLDKNNPLFKQAKTRAMQAMAARGIVNSSMAEEAVMSAMMNVAIPIATDVTNTYKEAMHKYADTGDLMKRELNQAFYEELITRVNNANQIKLREMTETGANWRAIMDAKSQAANIKGGPEFERYMAMLSKLG